MPGSAEGPAGPGAAESSPELLLHSARRRHWSSAVAPPMKCTPLAESVASWRSSRPSNPNASQITTWLELLLPEFSDGEHDISSIPIPHCSPSRTFLTWLSSKWGIAPTRPRCEPNCLFMPAASGRRGWATGWTLVGHWTVKARTVLPLQILSLQQQSTPTPQPKRRLSSAQMLDSLDNFASPPTSDVPCMTRIIWCSFANSANSRCTRPRWARWSTDAAMCGGMHLSGVTRLECRTVLSSRADGLLLSESNDTLAGNADGAATCVVHATKRPTGGQAIDTAAYECRLGV